MKITVDLDPDLYRAAKVEAARSDRSIRYVIEEAITGWLDAHEAAEDRESADQALAEYQQDGGLAAKDFYQRLVAETLETYGPTVPDAAAEDSAS